MTVRIKTWRRQRLGRAAAWLMTAALVLMMPGSGLVLAAPAAGATGVSASLTVASDPVGAAVFVDGHARGTTPLALDEIAAGEHRVQVSLDGYLENSRVVVVEPGESESLRVNLTPSGTRFARLQVEPEPEPVAPPPEEPIIEKKGGSGKKIAFIALGVAAVGAGVFLLLPKNDPPVAGSALASPTQALMAVKSVSFSASGASDPNGDPLTYTWDFGDGATAAGQQVSHVYTSAGVKTVQLTVSDGKESASTTTSVTVNSVDGTWRTRIVASQITFGLTQSGTNVTGSVDYIYGNPNCQSNGETITRGQVSSPRALSITVNVPTRCYGTNYGNIRYQFDCNLTENVTSCAGTATSEGNSYTIEMTKD